MIKAVIFDVDGVMTNAEPFSNRLEKDYGISKEKSLPFFENEFQDCLTGKADLKKELEKHLKGWGWQKSVDEFLDYWFKSEHQIDQALAETINTLKRKGIRCYAATNQEKYRTEYLLTNMGFSQLFEEVFSSAYIGHKKPAKEFYENVTNKIALDSNEIMFWDDRERNIEAAKKIGWHSELFTSYDDYEKKMRALGLL